MQIRVPDIVLRYERTSITLFLLLCIWPFYFVTNHLSELRHTATLAVWVDRAVPFVPQWQYIYAFVYIFLFLPIFVVTEKHLFRRAAACYGIILIVSFAVFLVYPVKMERPASLPDTFAAWALGVNYALDPPYNCFPSIHVGIAFIASLTALKVSRPVGVVALVVAFLISVSTLYVKQHYLLDVVAGAALALAAWAVLVRRAPSVVDPRVVRRGVLGAVFLGGLYFVVIASFYVAYLLRPSAVTAVEGL